MRTPSQLIIPGLPLGWQNGLDIREQLRPIEAGEIRRTVNGRAVSLMDPSFRKYALSLSSDDIRPPVLGDLWRGSELHGVVPTQEIGVPILAAFGMDSCVLPRNPHPGSVKCLDADHRLVAFTVNGRVVTLASPPMADVRVYFRPVLNMMVTGWSNSEQESRASSSWSLELEEI